MDDNGGRLYYIDAAKGLGILLVVIGHTDVPGRDAIYLFHMMFFFWLSGYCYQTVKSFHLKKLVCNRLRRLYLPSAAWNLFLVITCGLFMDLQIYSQQQLGNNIPVARYTASGYVMNAVKSLLFLGGGGQLAGTVWFLRNLFIVTIAFAIFEKLLYERLSERRAVITLDVAAIMSFAAGIICDYYRFLPQLTSCFVCFSIFRVGKRMSSSKWLKSMISMLMNQGGSKRKFALPAIVACMLILWMLSGIYQVEISGNRLGNPFLFPIGTAAGIFLVLLAVSLLCENNLVCKVLVIIGQCSLSIMLWHLLLFKLVTLAEIVVLDRPMENLAAFPVYLASDGWWLIYTLTGILGPLLLYKAAEAVKTKFHINIWNRLK